MGIGLIAICLATADTPFDNALRSGLTSLRSNDLKAAEAQLRAAIQLNPARPEPWLGLAQTLLKQGRSIEAENSAGKAEKLAASNPAIKQGVALYYAEAGRTYAATGKRAESILQFRQALRLKPGTESDFFELAQQSLQVQQFQEALETLQLGLKQYPNNAQLVLARGVALYGLRRFPDAVDAFLRTIKLAPEVEQPYRFLGRMIDVAESKLPSITEAFAAYAKSHPDSAMSNFLYAKALSLGSADAGQVESLLRKSIALNGQVWESYFELGLALERRQAYAEAATELLRASELNPSEPSPHYRLARVYDRLGRTAEAAEQRAIHARLSAQQKPQPEIK